MGKTNQLIRSLAYSFGGFSNGVYGAFTNVLLPLFLTPLIQSSAIIGFLVTISNFETALAPAIGFCPLYLGFFSWFW